VCLCVWRFDHLYRSGGTLAGECYGHTAELNQVIWWRGPNHDGNGLPAVRLASWYNEPGAGSDGVAPNCGSIAGWSNNAFDTDNALSANLSASLWKPAWDAPAFLPQNPYWY